MLVFGTRPEAIKMAPLVKLLKTSKTFNTIVCVTGQHRQMLDQVLDLFEIEPEYDLNIMKKNQDLYDITTSVMLGMRDVLKDCSPDLVLVHGDTTTSMATALAAFYQRISVGHVEAGLRTNNIYSPWPEEMNRLITSKIACLNFAPTELNKVNLLREGVSEDSISITGNTVIDALHFVINKINSSQSLRSSIEDQILKLGYNTKERLTKDKKIILITGHRRENFGEGLLNICKSIKTLSLKYPYVDFIYPMHMNPNVRKPINEVLNDGNLQNVFLLEPLDYLPFVYLMNKSHIILTDSGGIQEEAPGLKKPVLVMRDTTERPEALSSGLVKLVGTDFDKIVNEISLLLDNQNLYVKMKKIENPYGDGNASKNILFEIEKKFTH